VAGDFGGLSSRPIEGWGRYPSSSIEVRSPDSKSGTKGEVFIKMVYTTTRSS
jgi:hypothetical protein